MEPEKWILVGFFAAFMAILGFLGFAGFLEYDFKKSTQLAIEKFGKDADQIKRCMDLLSNP